MFVTLGQVKLIYSWYLVAPLGKGIHMGLGIRKKLLLPPNLFLI